MRCLSCSHIIILVFSIILFQFYVAENIRNNFTFISESSSSSSPQKIYDLKELHVPVLTGTFFRLFVKALQTWPLNNILVPKLIADSSFDIVRNLTQRSDFLLIEPTYMPLITPSTGKIYIYICPREIKFRSVTFLIIF